MENLIKSNKITPCELCERMAKYKGAIDRDALKIIKSEKIAGRGAAKETMENFSELLCRKLKGDTTVEGTVKALVSDLIARKIPISFAETFVFDFKDIILPYIQKEFSGSYYGSYNAQKITDAALRHIWMATIDEYYEQITETLEQSEEKFKSIFDNASDGILLADLATKKFAVANKTICTMLGYSEDELMKLNVNDIHPKKDLPYVLGEFKKQAQKKISLTENLPVQRKDGSIFYADINAVPVAFGGKTYLAGIFRDITEKRKAEEKLKESENKFRTLFDSSRDAIMTIEPPSWRFTTGNPATVKMFRAKNEAEFVSKGPWEVSPKYQPDGQLSTVKAKRMIMKAMKNGSNFFEWTHKRIGGEDFPATVLLTRMEIDGKPLVQATVRDITKEKKAEDSLKESENNFRAIFDNAGDGILVADMKTKKFMMANRKICKMLGYTENELKRLNVLSIHPKKDLPMVLKTFKLQAQKKLTVGRGLPMLRKNKSVFYADVSATPFVINGRTYLAGFFRESAE